MFAYISDLSSDCFELVLVGNDVRMLAMEVAMTGAGAVEEVDEAKVEVAVFCIGVALFSTFVLCSIFVYLTHG